MAPRARSSLSSCGSVEVQSPISQRTKQSLQKVTNPGTSGSNHKKKQTNKMTVLPFRSLLLLFFASIVWAKDQTPIDIIPFNVTLEHEGGVEQEVDVALKPLLEFLFSTEFKQEFGYEANVALEEKIHPRIENSTLQVYSFTGQLSFGKNLNGTADLPTLEQVQDAQQNLFLEAILKGLFQKNDFLIFVQNIVWYPPKRNTNTDDQNTNGIADPDKNIMERKKGSYSLWIWKGGAIILAIFFSVCITNACRQRGIICSRSSSSRKLKDGVVEDSDTAENISDCAPNKEAEDDIEVVGDIEVAKALSFRFSV